MNKIYKIFFFIIFLLSNFHLKKRTSINNHCSLFYRKKNEFFEKGERNFFIEKIESNCEYDKGATNYYKENESNEINENRNHFNSFYEDNNSKLNKLKDEFNFRSLGKLKCPGYPRLLALSKYWNNTWLLGGNDGNRVICRRSIDNGNHWTDPVEISKHPKHICSNVDFFELPNHDIISSYRAIGNPLSRFKEIKYNRRLCSSISHDGGKTWEDLGVIIDNFDLAKKLGKSKSSAIEACKKENRIGFFEPFVEMINKEVTVFYADDFTTMILEVVNNNPMDNYRTQNIYSQTFNINLKKWRNERNLIMDGTKKKSPTGSGLIKRISRDGMPVVSKMKDGTYILVFEGTYRDIDYPLLTGSKLKEYHWFEILLSYSRDGLNWSNPVEVYTPKYNGSKSSAPFVVSNEKNQLIISFQTDEDSITSGFAGDCYSIMKVMISKPNITIQNINNNSFYALCNNNNSPIGGSSIWNGMMIIKNTLYTCSSDNVIKYSKIPIYEE